MEFFIVDIEVDSETSLATTNDYKVFTKFDAAASLFSQLHTAYLEVVPVGRRRNLNVIGGRILSAHAKDEVGAIEAVKSGRAFVINDVTIGDSWREEYLS